MSNERTEYNILTINGEYDTPNSISFETAGFIDDKYETIIICSHQFKEPIELNREDTLALGLFLLQIYSDRRF